MAILNNVTNIYSGSTPVSKVMVGTMQVWPGGGVSPSGWPNDTNTGYSGTLTTVGATTVSTNSALFENRRVNGRLTITGNNVTGRNVHVNTGDYYGIVIQANNVLIEDVTVEGPETAGIAVFSGYFTGRRLNVFGCEDGIRMGSGSKLYDSYVHDLTGDESSHYDSVTADGATGWEIVHNTILNQNTQTACVWIGDPRYAPSEGLLQNNFLAGGGYTIYSGHSTGAGLRVLDNVFSTQYFSSSGNHGPVAYWEATNNTWSNNTWYDGPNAGQNVNP